MAIKISVVNGIWLSIKNTLHPYLQIPTKSQEYCARLVHIIIVIQSYDVSLIWLKFDHLN